MSLLVGSLSSRNDRIKLTMACLLSRPSTQCTQAHAIRTIVEPFVVYPAALPLAPSSALPEGRELISAIRTLSSAFLSEQLIPVRDEFPYEHGGERGPGPMLDWCDALCKAGAGPELQTRSLRTQIKLETALGECMVWIGAEIKRAWRTGARLELDLVRPPLPPVASEHPS